MAQLTFREAIARGIAQEMRRDESVVCLGEDIGAAGGVFKGTVGLIEEFGPVRVRDTPISEQAIIGAAMGAAMTGLRPSRRDHVRGLLRGLLGHRRQRDRQEPIHDQRSSDVPTRDPLGQRRRTSLRRPALPERGELGDDDPRAEGRRAQQRRRRHRTHGGVDPRRRPGDLPRGQVALRVEDGRARRRDRRHARFGEGPAQRFGRDGRRAGRDGAQGARRRGGAGAAPAWSARSSTCDRSCPSTPRRSCARCRPPVASSRSRRTRDSAAGAASWRRSSAKRSSTTSTVRSCGSRRRTFRSRRPTRSRTWRFPPVERIVTTIAKSMNS